MNFVICLNRIIITIIKLYLIFIVILLLYFSYLQEKTTNYNKKKEGRWVKEGGDTLASLFLLRLPPLLFQTTKGEMIPMRLSSLLLLSLLTFQVLDCAAEGGIVAYVVPHSHDDVGWLYTIDVCFLPHHPFLLPLSSLSHLSSFLFSSSSSSLPRPTYMSSHTIIRLCSVHSFLLHPLYTLLLLLPVSPSPPPVPLPPSPSLSLPLPLPLPSSLIF